MKTLQNAAKLLPALTILFVSLPTNTAHAAGIGVEGQVKASTVVSADETLPPEANAVVSGINTTPLFGGVETLYGLYGQATDSGPNVNEHESAGVFGRGFGNYAYGVKGIAGDLSSGTFSFPLGAIGVVGIGQNRGIVGSSASGTGLYATSETNYGVWGQSTSYRGVTGRTARADNNYGLYTPDNLFAKNYNSSGSTAQVFRYTGDNDIQPGDVVSFSGIQMGGVNDDDPMVTVNSTASLPRAAIAGVVASRFNIDAIRDDDDEASEKLDPTPAGAIRPGDYVLVVVRGPAEVNVDTSDIQAEPGALLISHSDSRSINAASPVSAAGETGQTIGILLGELPSASESTGRRSPQVGDPSRKLWIYVSPR